MRLLQVVQKPQRRGAEVFAYELSQHMRGRGVEVRTVYLYDYSGHKPLNLHPGDICLQAEPRTWAERVPGVQWSLLRNLRSQIRQFQPDIVQVNGSRTVKYGAVAKWLEPRSPWKLVYRNIDMPKFWNRGRVSVGIYRHLLMPKMRGVIGVSNASLRQAMDLYRFKVPAVVIRNGIDTEKLDAEWLRAETRRCLKVGDDDFVLLFVGSLVPQKRPDRFVDLVRELFPHVPGVQGWIVGDGPLRDEVASQISRNLPVDRCRLLGYQENVGRYIQAADVLVITSDTEGIPAVLLEAGYLRRPAVVTNVGALAECVRDGVTGRIVPPPFVENIGTALATLATNPTTLQAMGMEARKLIEAEYTMPTVAARYHEFYAEVARS